MLLGVGKRGLEIRRIWVDGSWITIEYAGDATWSKQDRSVIGFWIIRATAYGISAIWDRLRLGFWESAVLAYYPGANRRAL